MHRQQNSYTDEEATELNRLFQARTPNITSHTFFAQVSSSMSRHSAHSWREYARGLGLKFARTSLSDSVISSYNTIPTPQLRKRLKNMSETDLESSADLPAVTSTRIASETPFRRSRNNFTDEEDIILVRLYTQRSMEITNADFFAGMARIYPRHPAKSWKNRLNMLRDAGKKLNNASQAHSAEMYEAEKSEVEWDRAKASEVDEIQDSEVEDTELQVQDPRSEEDTQSYSQTHYTETFDEIEDVFPSETTIPRRGKVCVELIEPVTYRYDPFKLLLFSPDYISKPRTPVNVIEAKLMKLAHYSDSSLLTDLTSTFKHKSQSRILNAIHAASGNESLASHILSVDTVIQEAWSVSEDALLFSTNTDDVSKVVMEKGERMCRTRYFYYIGYMHV